MYMQPISQKSSQIILLTLLEILGILRNCKQRTDITFWFAVPQQGRAESHLRPCPGVRANGSSKTPALRVPPGRHAPCHPSPPLTSPAPQPLLQRVHAAVADPGVPFQMDPWDCLHQLQAPSVHRDQRIVLQVQVEKSFQWQKERDIKLLQAVVS